MPSEAVARHQGCSKMRFKLGTQHGTCEQTLLACRFSTVVQIVVRITAFVNAQRLCLEAKMRPRGRPRNAAALALYHHRTHLPNPATWHGGNVFFSIICKQRCNGFLSPRWRNFRRGTCTREQKLRDNEESDACIFLGSSNTALRNHAIIWRNPRPFSMHGYNEDEENKVHREISAQEAVACLPHMQVFDQPQNNT